MQSDHVSIDEATGLCLKSNYSHLARVSGRAKFLRACLFPLNIFVLKSEMYLVAIREREREALVRMCNLFTG